ncbi:hypothetical protein LEMA_P101420.1 [Plenodomus lingam JN3]|uniref:Pinin/SDK/MemA protein domain-containing protein n=2 Tax=Leptosphaeria maculans TaxID=5022 RepID=E5A0F1_LEPMJ|nr:hypothetical protein LEMA_P101420.1 [Plenodomus lingam JN3]CBX97011.1 hypothetical protein LEMA_P101420.1 [Plenodomus lingam JN3]
MPDWPANTVPSTQDSSMQQSTTGQSSNDDQPDQPPDEVRMREERAKQAEILREELALARKEQAFVAQRRMNLELLDMLKRPAKLKSKPSAKGIGLYTHIEGVSKPPMLTHERPAKGEPEFLPIGGPKIVIRNGPRSSALDDDVARLWNEVQRVVRTEEAFCKQNESSPDELNQRYAALEVPDPTPQAHIERPTQETQVQQQDVEMQDDMMLQEGNSGPALSGVSSTTIPTANIYEPSRDPRLQRR